MNQKSNESPKPMKQRAFRMSDEDYSAAVEVAEREGVSVGEFIRRAVENRVKLMVRLKIRRVV